MPKRKIKKETSEFQSNSYNIQINKIDSNSEFEIKFFSFDEK